jgi:hypothetical protein
MARKLMEGWAVYLCHNDFRDFDGKPALKKMSPKITDFGLAEQGDQPGYHAFTLFSRIIAMLQRFYLAQDGLIALISGILV